LIRLILDRAGRCVGGCFPPRFHFYSVLKELESRLEGLSQAEVDSRLTRYGLNEIAREKHQLALMRFLSNINNPLVILLVALAVLSFLTGDKTYFGSLAVSIVGQRQLTSFDSFKVEPVGHGRISNLLGYRRQRMNPGAGFAGNPIESIEEGIHRRGTEKRKIGQRTHSHLVR
jgi:hypothetical protein